MSRSVGNLLVIKGGQTSIEELCVAPVLGVKRGNLKLKLSGLHSKKKKPPLPEHERLGWKFGKTEV